MQAVSEWRDASGNNHVMRQTISAQRPSTIRTGTLDNSIQQPAYVRFTRSSGHNLVGDSDGIDFGIRGPMTVYVMSRHRNAATQVIMGRGAMAQTLTTGEGWVYAIAPTRFETTNGFIGLKLTDNNGTVAGGKTLNSLNPSSWTTQYLQQYAVSVGPAGAAQASSYAPDTLGATYKVQSCRDTACNTYQFNDFDNALWNNFSSPVSVRYMPTLPDNKTRAVPSSNQQFRIGGALGTTINTNLAWDADVFDIIMYREQHDLATRTKVSAWLSAKNELNACPMNISSAHTRLSGTDCITGPTWMTCNQTCARGRSWLGQEGYHTCDNGALSQAPLVCMTQCPDVIAPNSTASCSRRVMYEDFLYARDPSAITTRFITYPIMPIYRRKQMWMWGPGST
ncbi:hypothetical protein EON62_01125, partial [archaeon]